MDLLSPKEMAIPDLHVTAFFVLLSKLSPPVFLFQFYVNSGVPLDESALCFAAELWLLDFTAHKNYFMMIQCAHRKPRNHTGLVLVKEAESC